jgi:hypothetical protein
MSIRVVGWTLALLVGLCVGACGGPVSAIDAAPADAPPVPDAGVDAAPPPPDAAEAPRTLDLTGAAGRVSGGTYTFDIQIGHPADQGSAQGGTYSIEGGAAVKP